MTMTQKTAKRPRPSKAGPRAGEPPFRNERLEKAFRESYDKHEEALRRLAKL